MTIRDCSPSRDYRLDVVSAAFGGFRCNYSCPFCHSDYFPQTRPPGSVRFSLADGVRLCNSFEPSSFGIHLTGSGEPLLVGCKSLADIVQPLWRIEGCQSVSLTTNGYHLAERAEELRNLGVLDVNVSAAVLVKADPAIHGLTACGSIGKLQARVLRGIDAARRSGLTVDLNIGVWSELTEHVETLIRISRDYDVGVKLFPILSSSPGDKSAYLSHFRSLIRELASRSAPQIDSHSRYITLSWSLDGAELRAKIPDLLHRPPECHCCASLEKCEESCWRSVRVSPWFIQPCGVRTDNIYWYGERDEESLRNKLISGGKLPGGCRARSDSLKGTGSAEQNSGRGRFIVVEGSDGSGKSAVSQLLAGELGAVHYQTPPEDFRVRELQRILETEGVETSRFLFYLAAMHYADKEVRCILGSADVVCDRWLDSTSIYHSLLLGVSPCLPDSLSSVLSPDLVIVLDVDDDVQRARLAERSARFDKRWESSEIFRRTISKRYAELSGERVVHVCNNGSIEETLAACVREVQNRVRIF